MSSNWRQRCNAQPLRQKGGKRNRQPEPKDVKCTTTEEPAGPQPKDEKSFTNQEPAKPQSNRPNKFLAQFDRMSHFAGQFVRFEKDTDLGIQCVHVKMTKFDIRQIKKITRHNARAQQVQKPKETNYIDADLLPPSDSEDASELPTTANPNQGNRLYEIYIDYPQDDEEEEK